MFEPNLLFSTSFTLCLASSIECNFAILASCSAFSSFSLNNNNNNNTTGSEATPMLGRTDRRWDTDSFQPNIPETHGTKTTNIIPIHTERYLSIEFMDTYPRLAGTKESSCASNNHLPWDSEDKFVSIVSIQITLYSNLGIWASLNTLVMPSAEHSGQDL